ncbi:HD domain-containing protein [Sorangium sp. So ce145]|uniref:HD domain-containing protein n=1 Tax=Sorangium sp. So ce145 TaxID=3133285 RepID=UPI003F5EB21A
MLELEKALHQRCEADSQYATLGAQWTFDKQLIGQALQSVPLVFPHYSLHNASHADTILRQIARVLGTRRIERLSPTDLWLLLESAYYHDIGMIVPGETMRAWWLHEKFGTFLDGLKNHTDDDIRCAAELLDKNSDVRPQGETWPFDVQRALVLVMAEYARPRHPGESRKYINAPSLIDLRSPRTQLVPRRFWSLLGRICENHGLGFSETMKLPARESGFAMDEAHPRFVACMLRLGDLLDLDDGRFCPVLARTFGGLPPSSKAHKEKHHSIEEFLVDASEIRVVAECKIREAFDVTEQWFTWLRNELRDQSVHWAEISPEKNFGAVPSAGIIAVRLRGHLTSPDGRRPRFEVDKAAMLDFVRGAGLYSDETACIAELLQNAVDATLLRVWATNRSKWQRLHRLKDDQALEVLRGHLEKYPIDVHVRKSKRVGEENHWSVVIRDRGAGISRDDIPYLQCVGSSRKNPRRIERMYDMPEWMKPAGYFGIGLQSVFLFADRVVLRSRADDSMETIEIKLEQRSGSHDPQILVRVVGGKQALASPGTRVRFVLRELKVPKRYSLSDSDQETKRVARDFDALLDDELPILPSKVRDATREFGVNSLAHVRLDGCPVEQNATPAMRKRSNDRNEVFFDAGSGIELGLRAGNVGGFDFLYRGRRTQEHLDRWFLCGDVVLHDGNASQVLTINREKFRGKEARAAAEVGLNRALLSALPRYYERIRNDPGRAEECRYLALAIEVHGSIRDAGTIPRDECWRAIKYESSEVTLGDIVDSDRVRIVADPAWHELGLKSDSVSMLDDRKIVTIECSSVENWLWELLRGRNVVLQSVQRINDGRYARHCKLEWLVLRERPEDIVGDASVFIEIIVDALDRYRGRIRRTVPCPRMFRSMALAAGAERGLGYFDNVYGLLSPRAVFPFRVESDGKLSLEGVDELIRWTHEHRLEKETTEIDVARAVLALVQITDRVIGEGRGGSDDCVDYSVDDLRRRLRRRYGADVLSKHSGAQ